MSNTDSGTDDSLKVKRKNKRNKIPHKMKKKINKKNENINTDLHSNIEDIKTLNKKSKKIKENTNIKITFKNMDNYSNKDISTIEDDSHPKNIEYLKDITKDSYTGDFYNCLGNLFFSFNSIDNILYLIYTNINYSIVSYKIIDNKKINEIHNAHDNHITNFRHCLDENNKRDLVISISGRDNNLKLLNVNNWNCILKLENINSYDWINSVCFLKENEHIYIVTSNLFFYCPYIEKGYNLIKIFDFKGKVIKEINSSYDETYYINSFYDKNFERNYIITGNKNTFKAFDYKNNKLYISCSKINLNKIIN